MLKFDLSKIDLDEMPPEKVIFRNAARGITIKGRSVLMLRTDGPDYRFPGGVIYIGDTARSTLLREYREEVGRRVRAIRGMFCEVLESRPDLFVHGRYFKMMSRYWICLVYDEDFGQRLAEYESSHGFITEWVDIEEAIEQNRKALTYEKRNYWVNRELTVLEAVLEHLNKTKEIKEPEESINPALV